MVGFRNIPSSDPEEQRLRVAWHKAREAKETGAEGTALAFTRADEALISYIWQRAVKQIEDDRRKHPKARRNQKHEGPLGQGRSLP